MGPSTYQAMDKDQGVGVGRGGLAIPIVKTRARSLCQTILVSRKLLGRVDTLPHGNVCLGVGNGWNWSGFNKRESDHGQSHGCH